MIIFLSPPPPPPNYCNNFCYTKVSVIVTTAGGVEEDFIKCLAPTYMGDFSFPGVELRSKGLNRIGNLLVPNENYRKLEAWMTPILDAMVEEQKQQVIYCFRRNGYSYAKLQSVIWSPSKMIARLGKEINSTESVYYWAYKVRLLLNSLVKLGNDFFLQNDIPVFCPALTNGSIGDLLYFHHSIVNTKLCNSYLLTSK